uniref:Uncharacterized protein n=1 Tax=Anguilla anguilla TaxID=7936 RepID=A0A0E9X7X1_ANGAN
MGVMMIGDSIHIPMAGKSCSNYSVPWEKCSIIQPSPMSTLLHCRNTNGHIYHNCHYN